MCRSLLEGMAALPSLQSLSFEVMSVAARGAHFGLLSKLTNLTSLNIGLNNSNSRPDIHHSMDAIMIPHMANLQYLTIRSKSSDFHNTILKIGTLAASNYRAIIIGNGLVVPSFPPSPYLERFHYHCIPCPCWIDKGHVTDIIKSAKALKSLICASGKINRDDIEQIVEQHHQSLTSFHLLDDGTKKMINQTKDDKSSLLFQLSQLNRLQMLTLPPLTFRHRDYDDILILSTLTNLRSFGMDMQVTEHNSITKSVAKLVQQLPQLELAFGQSRQQWLTTYQTAKVCLISIISHLMRMLIDAIPV
jgi:hypothetical protein